jgi:hypothetical protein
VCICLWVLVIVQIHTILIIRSWFKVLAQWRSRRDQPTAARPVMAPVSQVIWPNIGKGVGKERVPSTRFLVLQNSQAWGIEDSS